MDGVILSERGMTCLKQQTVEREKTRRRKRVGIGGEGYDPMNPNAPPGDGSDNDDDGPEDDIMPPPTPGPSGPASLGMMGKGKKFYHLKYCLLGGPTFFQNLTDSPKNQHVVLKVLQNLKSKISEKSDQN